jgi:hypothetical protein
MIIATSCVLRLLRLSLSCGDVAGTQTEIANARLEDVTKENPNTQDSMKNFWFAETSKYFYLLFSETGLVS